MKVKENETLEEGKDHFYVYTGLLYEHKKEDGTKERFKMKRIYDKKGNRFHSLHKTKEEALKEIENLKGNGYDAVLGVAPEDALGNSLKDKYFAVFYNDKEKSL